MDTYKERDVQTPSRTFSDNTHFQLCNLSISGLCAAMFKPLLRKRHSPRGVFSKAASCVCAELCTAIDIAGGVLRGAQPEV